MNPQTIPYKYYVQYVNGEPVYQALASENTPQGYKELSKDQFVAGVNEQLAKENAYMTTEAAKKQNALADQGLAQRVGAGRRYDANAISYLTGLLNDTKSGKYDGPSDMVMGVDPLTGKTGQMTLAEQASIQAQQQGIADGSQVSFGQAGLTVPAGSPGLANLQNPGSVPNQTLPGGITAPLKVGSADGPVIPGVTPGGTAQTLATPTTPGYQGATTTGGTVPPPSNTGTPTGTAPVTNSAPVPGATGTPTPAQQQAAQLSDQEFTTWLNSQNLSADQKAALSAVYGAIGTGDQAQADKIKAAIEAGTAFSDPYFAAQSKLLVDALDRGLSAKEGDLAYNETSLANRLADLKKTIQDSSSYMTFQQQQEMKDLERKYTADLDNTQQDMAARGFTSSSIRNKKEGLLSDVYGDMRESTNRAFQYKKTGLTDQGNSAQRDYALEVARLRDLTAQGKIDLLRNAESNLGSDALGGAGYTDLLGGIGGELPRQKAQDAISFATQFAF